MEDDDDGKPTSRRSRRSTQFREDFRFKDFSDLDSDEDNAKERAPANNKTSRNRTKTCPGCDAQLNTSVKECTYCDYAFTAKTVQANQLSVLEESKIVRARFPFEPDREDDGSLKIESIFGRRLHSSDARKHTFVRGISSIASATDAKFEHEYLVKFKTMSYVHVQWLTAQEIDMMNPKSKMVLTRYLNKLDNNDPGAQEDGEFEASFTEVSKILDHREETVFEVQDDGTPEVVQASTGGEGGRSAASQGVSSGAGSGEGGGRGSRSRLGNEREGALITAPLLDDNGDEVLLARTKIWQPLERCRRVLEKLWDDPYSTSFQQPVDTNQYEDYLDTVTTPMCLQDVLDKLDAGVYKNQHLNKFANDMRLIWNNCKIYNLHKSQIWYCAHALSLQFERLYQAWVWSFAAGDLFLSDPVARPWEPVCRVCLSDEQENEDLVMLCDHCDASYHIYCLDPPLARVPEDAWVCARCSSWLAASGAKCLSATAEDTARTMTDNTREKTVIGVKKSKYLVKWTGLPYSECTWELARDINDDQAIAAYHKLNDSPPEEPPLTQAELGTELTKNPKNTRLPALTMPSLPREVEAAVYSQIRALHFLQCNLQAPPALLKECGPACFSSTYEDMCVPLKLPADVAAKVGEMVAVPDIEVETVGVDHCDSKSEGEEGEEDDESEDGSERGGAGEDGADKAKEGTEIDTSVENDDDNEVGDKQKDEEGGDEEDKGEEEQDEQEDQEEQVRKPQPLQWCWPFSAGEGAGDIDDTRVQVAGVLGDMVHAVARGKLCVSAPCRAPLRDKEVEVCVGKGADGLYMNIGSYKDRVVVLGFRKRPCGRLGPAEMSGLIKVGDILVAINGLYVAHLAFSKIITLLSSKEFPFVFLRFLRHQNNFSDALDVYLEKKTSLGDISSTRPIPFQSKYFGVRRLAGVPSAPQEQSRVQWLCEVVDDYAQVTVGTFATELGAAEAYDAYQLNRMQRLMLAREEQVRQDKEKQQRLKEQEKCVVKEEGPSEPEEEALGLHREMEVQDENCAPTTASGVEVVEQQVVQQAVDQAEKKDPTLLVSLAPPAAAPPIAAPCAPAAPRVRFNFKLSAFLLDGSPASEPRPEQHEPTAEALFLQKQVAREYALTAERLAALSAKNEASLGEGKEDVHSLDSFDSDTDKDAAGGGKERAGEVEGAADDNEYPTSSDSDSDEWSGASESDEESDEDERGGRGRKDSKKAAAVVTSTVTSTALQECGPVGRLLRAVRESTFPPVRHEWSNHVLDMGMTKVSLKDTFKNKRVEQIDLASGEVMHIWDSVGIAARRLNIPATQINSVLANKLDNGGGFKWRIATASSSVHEHKDEDDEDIANAKKKDRNWQEKMHKVSKEYLNGGKLRDYQVDGLNWLLRCWYTKLSSILADEMGLGKTVQIVSFLDHLFNVEKIRGPFLVCVPLSTIEHWRRECEGWSNMVACVYHDVRGGRDMRDIIREYEWFYKDRSRRLLKFHVLITTYDDLIRDYEELAEVPWRAVVVDEAHRLRNTNSKLLECMRSVVAKGQIAYGYQHRVLMTGTPLQNNTAELWSLLNFIEPAKFPDAEKFESRYGDIKTQEQVESLQRRISPHLLRRVKEDVAKDIPAKQETIIDVELTTMQKQYYRAIFERNHSFLMQTTKGSLPKLMNIQMELRKCCNHPFLIAGVMEKEMDRIDEALLSEAGGQAGAVNWDSFEARRVTDSMIPTSGKMVLLDKLLPKLKTEGHKVLIFSQMVKMLDLIEEFCDCRNYNVERLDGRVSGNDRQKGIDRFNANSDAFIFLLSTRAGGVGINLTAADTCIIFDSDWNPQNDVQAMARCHRIGQTKAVTIYRLITRKSFEAEMFDRASRKLGLEQALLGSRQFEGEEGGDDQGQKMDAKEMETLLRQGAYAVLLEDDAEAVKEFCEQDIDSILDQRSHVRVVEGQQTESWLNKKRKGSRANKSMFTGDTAMEHAEIDVNDPDFWKKVLPDLVTPEMMLTALNELSKAGKQARKEQEDDEEEEEDWRGAELVQQCNKFFSDLSQMMEGIMDLQRRNTLPDRERTLCMKLLLRVTLKTDLFGDAVIIDQAQEWLTALEGTRRRGNRQELYTEAQNDNLLASPSAATDGRRGRGGKKPGPKPGFKGGPRGRPPKEKVVKAAGAGGRRGKKSRSDSDEFSENDDTRTVKPPRKKRLKRAEQEARAMEEDEARFARELEQNDEQDEDIRIVFQGGEVVSPPLKKKRQQRRKKQEDDADGAEETPKEPKLAKVGGAKGKRGRREVAEEGGGAKLSSAKSLFQQRAQSRRAQLAEERNGDDEAEELQEDKSSSSRAGRKKRRRDDPSDDEKQGAGDDGNEEDESFFAYEDRSSGRQRRPSLATSRQPAVAAVKSNGHSTKSGSTSRQRKSLAAAGDDDDDKQEEQEEQEDEEQAGGRRKSRRGGSVAETGARGGGSRGSKVVDASSRQRGQAAAQQSDDEDDDDDEEEEEEEDGGNVDPYSVTTMM